MPEIDPIARHPRFRRLADYLAAKAPPGVLPGRQHIDPLEIPDLLPYLMLIEIVPRDGGTAPYRIRLVGTEVVTLQGAEITGKFVDEVLTGLEGPAILEGYGEIVRSHRPQYRRGTVATPGRSHAGYERLTFPLAGDGAHVDMLISVFVMAP
jgi:hypothetical protein